MIDTTTTLAMIKRIKALEDAHGRRAAQETPLNPMTATGDLIVGGTPVGSAPAPYTRLAKGGSRTFLKTTASGNIVWDFAAKQLLSYTQSTDVWAGTSQNIGTYNLFSTSPTFTVADANNMVLIMVTGSFAYMVPGNNAVNMRLFIDGSQFTYWNTGVGFAAGVYNTVSLGGAIICHLTAGSHTVQMMIGVTVNSTNLWFRPASTANEQGGIMIAELGTQ